MTERIPGAEFERSCDLAVQALEEILYRALLGGEIERDLEVVTAEIDAVLGTVIEQPAQTSLADDPARVLLRRLAEVFREAGDLEGSHARG